ncbi:upstream stimulatory factor 2-like isoform X2 [Daphnia pulicaria]|uniref:upstream stimulatory factor 2-like isoform X2 n=1 Tax=Daphnia pulicaria TaxID=35523 RepID=UPI001EEA55B3|nr:upstream stimulatory factor 2-like isoform X2 [Daphnia pulicaria]
MDSLEQGIGNSPDKDSVDDPEMLVDNRILAPGITIVEEEGTLTSADLDGNSGSNENAVMYRVMQVGSSGEMIELPQIVTGNFTSGTTQPALINPLNTGHSTQFYIVGAAPDMLNTGTQRTIAPRGSVPERTIPVSRESSGSRASAVHGETRDGQFFIVGAATDMLTGGTPRTIAPRGNVPERSIQNSRESTSSSAGHGEPRDDRRRVSHNEVERRRRDKINNWILKLGKIMPDSVHNDAGKTGQSKGGILSKACDYITDIRTANQRLAEALRQSEHHVEELQAENAALRKELEQLHMSGIGKG